MSNGTIQLSDVQRDEMEGLVQRSNDGGLVRRLLAILNLDRLGEVAETARVVRAARSSVTRWRDWFLCEGIDGLRTDEPGPARSTTDEAMQTLVDELVGNYQPGDFGYLRSTWSSRLLADAIEQMSERTPHPSTLRRLLDEMGYAWKRARPTLHKADPDKEEKLEAIDEACAACDSTTATFFVDEVAIELNPTIGFGWSEVGTQTTVETPGINEKIYIAGALHADTGTITAVSGPSHNTDLFCRLADRVRLRYRGFSDVNLICDNAPNHRSNPSDAWFESHPRMHRIFQPVYHPWVNRIEKLWRQLHETVTRHHTCSSIDELLNKVWRFVEAAEPFPGSQPGLSQVA